MNNELREETLLKEFKAIYTEMLELRYKQKDTCENIAKWEELQKKSEAIFKTLYKELGTDPEKICSIKHEVLKKFEEYI